MPLSRATLVDRALSGTLLVVPPAPAAGAVAGATATGATVPLGLVTGLILTLGIQPVGVQTVTLLMTRPSLLRKVVPPEAAKVPLACKSPATCKVVRPFSGAPVSWPRTVRVLPLFTTVSRFRVRMLATVPVVSVFRAWSVCETGGGGAGEDGGGLECRSLLRPKILVPSTIRITKLRATA